MGACVPDLPADRIASSSGSGSGASSGSGGDASGSSGSSSGTIPAGCGDGYIDLAAGEQCDPGSPGSAVGGCNADCTMQCSADAGFVWAKNNHCYELAGIASSLYGATRTLCYPPGTAQPAHVATFASEEEFTAVAARVDAGWFWVGLQEPMNNNDYTSVAQFEPGWLAQCTGCYVHTTDVTMGLPKSPVVGTGGYYCVQGSSDLKQRAWQMVPCAGIDPGLPVVCEREPVGTQAHPCEAGTCIDLVWTQGTKSYVYGAEALTADEAEAACRGIGGRLVVLRSRDEREQLWKELGKLTSGVPGSVWIGLSEVVVSGGDAGVSDGSTAADSSAASVWVWDDDAGVDAYVSPWGYDQPRTTAHSPRAYLLNEQPQASDDTTARTDPLVAPGTLPYVCEVP
jgi:hypothetical protein